MPRRVVVANIRTSGPRLPIMVINPDYASHEDVVRSTSIGEHPAVRREGDSIDGLIDLGNAALATVGWWATGIIAVHEILKELFEHEADD